MKKKKEREKLGISNFYHPCVIKSSLYKFNLLIFVGFGHC